MATENPWRARKIQAELAKLGIRVSLATISRYLPKAEPGPGQHQRWMTFLRNHKDLISGMDFFVVPTVRFRLLYVWFALDHGRRRLLHFNVTDNPTAAWVIQQMRQAFPDTPTHRFLIFDNDAIFSAEVVASMRRLGIRPKRTAFRSPWQNGLGGRLITGHTWTSHNRPTVSPRRIVSTSLGCSFASPWSSWSASFGVRT
jgi:hypothetical protein